MRLLAAQGTRPSAGWCPWALTVPDAPSLPGGGWFDWENGRTARAQIPLEAPTPAPVCLIPVRCSEFTNFSVVNYFGVDASEESEVGGGTLARVGQRMLRGGLCWEREQGHMGGGEIKMCVGMHEWDASAVALPK